jgi:hypothetical protein
MTTTLSMLEENSYKLNSMNLMIDELIASESRPINTIKKSTIGCKKFSLDLNQSNANNKIFNEHHKFKEDNNTNVIKPLANPFFKKGLVIKHGNKIFKEGKDYILGYSNGILDKELAKKDIYDYILLLDKHYEHIDISYHTVGGDISKLCLNKDIVKAKQNKLTINTKKSEVNTEWFTIGEFGIDGFTSGNFNLSIYSEKYNWGYNIALNINLTSLEKLSYVMLSEYRPKDRFNINNKSTFKYINNNLIKLRVLWNGETDYNNINNYSGAIIQLGYCNTLFDRDTINIELTSYTEKFTLYKNAIGPFIFNDNIMLPNTHKWVYNENNSNLYYVTLCSSDGFDIWVGDYSLIDTCNGSVNLDTNLSKKIPKFDSIKYSSVVLYDKKYKCFKTYEFPHSNFSCVISGEIVLFINDIIIFRYVISKSDGKIILSISTESSKNNIEDRFSLKRILFKF